MYLSTPYKLGLFHSLISVCASASPHNGLLNDLLERELEGMPDVFIIWTIAINVRGRTFHANETPDPGANKRQLQTL
jgi:hypothetical protein